MAGANTLFRIVATLVVLAAIAIITPVMYLILDALFLNMDFSAAKEMGWDNRDTLMKFAGLSLVGLSIVMILWMILAPIRQDVRQDVGPPGPY